MRPVLAATIVALLVVLVWLCRAPPKDGFVSARAREVHGAASAAFRERGPDISFTDYRDRVPGADAVQYEDMRNLFRAGRLTPEAVQRVM